MGRRRLIQLLTLFTLFAGSTDASAQISRISPVPLGIYHLPAAEEAVNLSLNTDGTFFWNVCGGDYQHSEVGIWMVENDSLVLLPATTDTSISWPNVRTTGDRGVTSVRIESGQLEGQVTVAGQVTSPTGAESPERFQQTWREGRICVYFTPDPPSPPNLPVPVARELCDLPLEKDQACRGLLNS